MGFQHFYCYHICLSGDIRPTGLGNIVICVYYTEKFTPIVPVDVYFPLIEKPILC